MINTLTDLIDLAEINQTVNLPADIGKGYLAWVRFTCDSDGRYCWVAGHQNRRGYIYPMRSVNLVNRFKTVKGAKQNFLQMYKFI